MKKTLAFLLLAAALLSLAGCGSDKNTPEPPAETAAPTPVATAAPTPEATPVPEATATPAPEEPASASPKELAEACIGGEVSELYDAVGEPDSADYSPSCLGPGEDGELIYDGFTVYTYREDGVETVRVVD